jgi:FtsP/CotA-like multicopper oxidase with cupredoxin domain
LKKDPNKSDQRVSRRRFVTVATSALATALIQPRTIFGQNTGSLVSNFSESFFEPLENLSQGGVLDTTLRVVEADVSIRGPQGMRVERTRCYNGAVPGPTLKLRPGEELRIRLINDLSGQGGPCGMANNRPHCFNTTNLHTHGLHVSPKSPSDNSFLKIEPQTDFQYSFRVPDFHPAGTFWYHAHVHGSTGLQVMNGLAGALIIQEPDTERPVPESSDRVWLIQEIMGKDAEKLYTCNHPHASYTVNGKFQPSLRARTGEVQRWRFINATATPGGYMDLQLLDRNNRTQQLFLIAIDGYPLRRTQARTSYLLPPGGRADFLVQLSGRGKYTMMGRRFQGQASDQTLGVINCEGKPHRLSLSPASQTTAPFLAPITDKEIVNRRTIRFQICPDQARGDTCKNYPNAKLCSSRNGDEVITNAFLINGLPYDPDRIDHSIKLGTAEEWELINETGAEHPFHIHVNHFQVMQPGMPPEDWVWRDTVSLPMNGSVRIRSRFRDYPGRFLLHCHILLHSDLGMMQNVEVR